MTKRKRKEERELYRDNLRGLFNEHDITRLFNARVVRETLQQYLYYNHIQRMDVFQRRYAVRGVFVKWVGQHCQVAQVIPV